MASAVDCAEVLALAEALIAVDSVNPDVVPGGAGEGELAAMVAGWLADRGVETTTQEVVPGRRNVIGRVRGSSGETGLMINAHLDTVGTAGMVGGLAPSVEDGRLYGRGAQDMKSGLAAAMSACAAAVRLDLRHDLVLAAVVDEEGESKGTEALLGTYTASAGVVLEPTGHVIVPAHKGFVWADIETRGVAAHGSDAEQGVDAILGMGHVLVALDALAADLRRRPPVPPVGLGSLHASLISGGREIPTYPDSCALVVERRTVGAESEADVLAELRRAVASARATDDGARWSAEVRSRLVRMPLATPADAWVTRALVRACRSVLGHAELGAVAFWTDAALMSAAGIPSVVFGVTGGGMHGAREWVDVSSPPRVAAVLLAAAVELCS